MRAGETTGRATSPAFWRIHVVGNSASGKSASGMRLAAALGAPFVDLDALNWQLGRVALNDTDPGELDRRIREATHGERWVVAGSYVSNSQRTFRDRLDTVIWLDLPMPLLLWRVLRRTWRRWRSRELPWGSNYERFWSQFLIWRKHDSLLAWIVTRHAGKRREMMTYLWRIRLNGFGEIRERRNTGGDRPSRGSLSQSAHITLTLAQRGGEAIGRRRPSGRRVRGYGPVEMTKM